MQLFGNRLVLSPSDLVAHLCCAHVTELTLEVARGQLERPAAGDQELDVLERRGLDHEAAWLERLRRQGKVVVEIDAGPLRHRVRQTLEVLAAGPDVVYQAAFLDEEGDGPAWQGHADFCQRVPTPSQLGGHSYEPSDTKLARHVKPAAVLQLCEYAAQLARIQGFEPESVHVVLGGEEVVTLRTADFAAYHRGARWRFALAAAEGASSEPLPNSHCPVCPWLQRCEDRWRAEDHLVRVAGLTVEQSRRLRRAGIATAGALAASAAASVKGISDATVDKLRHQARLQRAAVPGRPPPYELLTPATGQGLDALPEPSPGDLFFDIEGDPYVGRHGLEYLLGVGWWEEPGEFAFRAFWAHDAHAERRSFEAFIDFVVERRRQHPGMHVYHYAPYETLAVGKLMGRYGTREAEVDEFFRAGVFVDLYRVVRQAVRVGAPSYSLKKLEGLYMGRRTDAIVDAGSSIVEYERWLNEGEQSILDDIERYNRLDVESTSGLRDWLEERRAEFAGRSGHQAARPLPLDGSAPEAVVLEATAVDEVVAQLPDDDTSRLLGNLLGWHRRDEKPEWWQHFRWVAMDEHDLLEDTEAIAGLIYLGPGETIKKSVVHRYSFDPSQEFKLRAEQVPLDPEVVRRKARGEEASHPGTIHFVDAVNGIIGLRRGATSSAEHPRCLIPPMPVGSPAQREALLRVGRAVVASGIDRPGPYRAVRDLLLRQPPRRNAAPGPVVGTGETPADAAVRVATELDGGCLAVQGPPGSGKTRAAARIAVTLLAQGRTVGITANSHAVIGNLLAEILARAADSGVAVQATQKADAGQGLDHPLVSLETDNAKVAAALDRGTNLVAGTSWLYARDEFDGRLDHLIIDEAGQLSLANAVAVGTAARNLVLVGDPRQLSQPSQGTHPEGAGVSALEHLLGEHDTMPPELGIFLDHTHRLHPDICRFISEVVYDGRLEADPDCARQTVTGTGPMGGSGIRWHPVAHGGNRCSSDEEVDEVVALHAELRRRRFVDRHGVEHPIDLADILVVAPYNAQVSALAQALPAGARVGTVDKFQGQQAPVVIVSMASSSVEEVPRGMEFLYSRNRLNVAVSRAQALAVVVASPALLSVRCNSVEQLRLANGLCRLVELAGGAG